MIPVHAWPAQAAADRAQGILPDEIEPAKRQILRVYQDIVFAEEKNWSDLFFAPARFCHQIAMNILNLPENSRCDIGLKFICMLGILLPTILAKLIAIPGCFMHTSTLRLQTAMSGVRQSAWQALLANDRDNLRATMVANFPENTFRWERQESSFYRFSDNRLAPVRVITLQQSMQSFVCSVYDKFASINNNNDIQEEANNLEELLHVLLTPRRINRGDAIQLETASATLRKVQIIVAEDFSRMEILAMR